MILIYMAVMSQDGDKYKVPNMAQDGHLVKT